MDDSEHAAIVAREANGELTIGVDRVFARRFYTDTPLPTIRQNTGETPYVAKLLVMTAFIASPLALLGASVLAALTLRWWAILVAPVCILLWALGKSASSVWGSRLAPLTLGLGAVGAAWLLGIGGYTTFWCIASAYLAALWLDRFVYVGSTTLLRAFVIRNPRAFRWLAPGLVIRARSTAAA
jgi:hypothetical protein